MGVGQETSSPLRRMHGVQGRHSPGTHPALTPDRDFEPLGPPYGATAAKTATDPVTGPALTQHSLPTAISHHFVYYVVICNGAIAAKPPALPPPLQPGLPSRLIPLFGLDAGIMTLGSI